MTTHRIDLQAPEKGHGKTRMSYLGQPIGASDFPIFAAARWLLANGHASPNDTIATYRGEMLCMSGKAGVLAKRTVEENASRLRLVKYRSRRDGVPSWTGKSGVPAALPGTRTCGFWAMTAHVLVSGTVCRAPEQRTSKPVSLS